MDSKVIEIADVLSRNLPFRMSLSAKESFHGNMLQWILLSDDFDSTSLQKLFQPDVASKAKWHLYDVLREQNKFDLILVYTCIDGDEFDENTTKAQVQDMFRFVVIQNKFKTIPYKEQLQELDDKLLRSFAAYEYAINEEITFEIKANEENTCCYLLAPDKALKLVKNELGFWKGVSYEKVNKCVSEFVVKNKFVKEYLNQYSSFLDALIDLSNVVVKDSENIKITQDNVNQLKDLKIDDFYETLWANAKFLKITENLTAAKVKLDYKNASYVHGQGLMEWKVLCENRKGSFLHLGLQIQGNEVRVLMEPKKGFSYKNDSDESRKNNTIKWINSVFDSVPNATKNKFFEKTDDAFVKTNKGGLFKLGSYKYLYCNLKENISEVTNDDYNKLIVKLIKTMITSSKECFAGPAFACIER